ncbi:MAG: hypothetical protein LW834_07990 [Cyanobium sp. 49614_E6]|jgi:hypothetical protein|nr:hypothetical protein [Cyanobium sp. 49614_E6]
MPETQRMVQTSADAKTFRAITRLHVREAQKCPEIWDLMHRHHAPSGYASWADHVALCHTLAAHTAKLQDDKEVEAGQALSLLFLKLFKDTQAPPRFLDQGLAESLLHTDLAPVEEAPPMALPCFRLFLPKGLAQLDTGSDIDVALVVDRLVIARLTETGSEKGPGLAVLFPIATGETYFIDFLWKDPNGNRFDDDTLWTPSLVKAARLCAHAVLVMAYMPELVAADPAARIPGGRGFGKAPETPQPAGPVWIGRDFQRQVQPPRPRPADQKHHQAPRRAHWRQGHWRSVACGPKRQKRRLRWIQPVFVNAASCTSPEAHA